MAEKRYEQYPDLAARLREMTPEGRELVALWHRILTTALEGYIPAVKREVNEAMGGAARLGAGVALERWLKVMRDVAAIIVDPSEADWCCKPGMLAHPAPCPQHSWRSDCDYELGTIIRREYGAGVERAIKVADLRSIDPYPWRSVEFPMAYNNEDIAAGNWQVIGRA